MKKRKKMKKKVEKRDNLSILAQMSISCIYGINVVHVYYSSLIQVWKNFVLSLACGCSLDYLKDKCGVIWDGEIISEEGVYAYCALHHLIALSFCFLFYLYPFIATTLALHYKLKVLPDLS